MKKRLFGILLSFAMMLTMMPILSTIEANATSVDVWYWYDSENKTLHLSESKLSDDYSQTSDQAHAWRNFVIIYDATTVVFDNQISPNTTEDWFESFESLTTINNPENLDMSSVGNMSEMFLYCESLKKLDASSWKTSSVTGMTALFAQCRALTELDISGWDTAKVGNMNNMFESCVALETIYVSENADWSKATANSDEMFYNCIKLVGGAGTSYKDTNPTDKTYARVDRGVSNPGYFTAKSAPVENVTVTFDSADGSPVASQTIAKGGKAEKPADPTKDGYTFDGWYLGSTAFDFSAAVNEDITLVAHWKKNSTPTGQSTITYDLNGGTLNGETGKVAVKVNNGTEITLPAPTRDGYTFDYWEGSKYNAGDKYTVNGDHTFKAVWKTGASGDGSKGGSSKKGVNTGDENTLGAWIVLLVAALAGTTGMAFARKRRND